MDRLLCGGSSVSPAIVLLNLRGRGDWIWYGDLLAILVAFNAFAPIRSRIHIRG